jgi:hypothetical protein
MASAFFITTCIVSRSLPVGLNSIVSVPGSAAGVCPGGAVEALLLAGCDLWEKEGYIMVQLKAIVVLEPDASRIIDEQYADRRSGMERLARGLKKAGRLREGWSVARATAALHALTSVETFMLLRRDHGLPLATVKQTIVELSRDLLTE